MTLQQNEIVGHESAVLLRRWLPTMDEDNNELSEMIMSRMIMCYQ